MYSYYWVVLISLLSLKLKCTLHQVHISTETQGNSYNQGERQVTSLIAITWVLLLHHLKSLPIFLFR